MIKLKNKRILLVGGAGFIGHNIALELSRLGANVSIIDNLQVNNLLSFWETYKNIPNREIYINFLNQRLNLLKDSNVSIYIEDARDYQRLSRKIDDIKPEVLIHLAAVAHANISNKDPQSTFDHNLRTLENCLDVARECVDHFIYFSSSMVYGNFVKGIVDEETECNPLGIYGSLKLAGERMVKSYNQVFGLNYTIVRPSALYGQRCVSKRVGQIFIENAIQGKEIVLQGKHGAKLDFTYINDLVSGIINVIKNKKSRNQIFNLTYGESRSIGDLLKILKQYFPNIKVKYMPKDKLTPNRGTLSIEKAKKYIGYNPKYPIDIGYNDYIKWYKLFFK